MWILGGPSREDPRACRHLARPKPDSSLFDGMEGSSGPYRPLISVAPSEPRRSLTVVPSIQIEGTTVRLRRGLRDGLVQGWRNRGPEVRLFGVPSWVRMGRRDAGDG